MSEVTFQPKNEALRALGIGPTAEDSGALKAVAAELGRPVDDLLAFGAQANTENARMNQGGENLDRRQLMDAGIPDTPEDRAAFAAVANQLGVDPARMLAWVANESRLQRASGFEPKQPVAGGDSVLQ